MKVRYIVLIGLLVVGLWVAGGMFLPRWLGNTQENLGQFGDKFGGINALFSGLAFAGVIIAIVLQSKELELQRKELELTRNVLEEQKDAMEEQSVTMQMQRFENTLFQMLSLHSELVTNLNYATFTGNGVVDELKSRCLSFVKTNGLEKISVNFFGALESAIGPLLKNTLVSLELIARPGVEDKRFYVNAVKAQLSSSELVLLFYYCLDSENGFYKDIIEKIHFFEGLTDAEVGFPDFKEHYNKSAFGKYSSIA